MLRSDPIPQPSALEQKIDRATLASILISPLAVGINTIVGYTVAHWVCDINKKTTGYLVSAVDFVLCLIAALLAWWAYRRVREADETQPEPGRRQFMAKMGLVLSVFAAIVVLAGTLAMLTLNPCD
jgi:cytosine/uracil/thiamine/allantoin permease